MVEFRHSPTWTATQPLAPDERKKAPAILHADLDIETEVRRQWGPVDIDDGPYHCDVVPCQRLQGFRTQEALDRHKRLQHPPLGN